MSQSLRHAGTVTPFSGTSAAPPLQDSLLGRLVTMAKSPTTMPRWQLLLTYGALILTILGGAVAFGRASARTDAAIARTEVVPQLQNQLGTLQSSINEIAKKQDEAADKADKRLGAVEKQQTDYNATVQRLEEKVNSLTSTNGSAWALSQSNAIRLGKLEGMIETMQKLQIQQMQQRD